MAADPTLADRLDDLANDRRWDCWSMHGERVQRLPEGYEPSIDCCDAAEGFHSLRAAAVRLRKLEAAIDDAGSISTMLSRHTDSCSYCSAGIECEVSDFVERIADALGPGGE